MFRGYDVTSWLWQIRIIKFEMTWEDLYNIHTWFFSKGKLADKPYQLTKQSQSSINIRSMCKELLSIIIRMFTYLKKYE